MKRKVKRPYEKDKYFKKWLVGLSPRTKKNYTEEFGDWVVFVGQSTPSIQPDGLCGTVSLLLFTP